MSFLVNLIIFILIIYLVFKIGFKLFGRWIFKKIIVKSMQNMENSFHRRYDHFQDTYDPNYEKEVNYNSELKIKVPKTNKKDPAKMNNDHENIQDVDFEEIK